MNIFDDLKIEPFPAWSVTNKPLTCIYLQNVTMRVLDICHPGKMERREMQILSTHPESNYRA